MCQARRQNRACHFPVLCNPVFGHSINFYSTSVQSEGWGLVEGWSRTGVEIPNYFGGVLALCARGTGHSSPWGGCCGWLLQHCSGIIVREVCACELFPWNSCFMMLCLALDWKSPWCQNFWHLHLTLVCPVGASLAVFCVPCVLPAQIVSLSRDEQGQGCVNPCLLYPGNSQGRFECYIWDVAGSESRQPSYFWWRFLSFLNVHPTVLEEAGAQQARRRW